MNRRGAAVAAVALLAAAGCTASAPTATPGLAVSHTASPRAGGVSPAPSPSPVAAAVPMDLVSTPWTRAIQRVVNDRNVSVAVGVGDRIVFSLAGTTLRMPASNEKLLTSMTALTMFGPGHRFPTVAEASGDPPDGVLPGDLWLVGSGDPELDDAGLAILASRLAAGGLREVRGSVVGDTSAFTREWWAPGWLPGISREFVTRPTALALDGNLVAAPPERAAAASLTRSLERDGVRVDGAPGTGAVPKRMTTLAVLRSAPLRDILERQNHGSINFDAEMITKALGAERSGPPGSTASGANAIERWVTAQGVHAEVRDGSGLSHDDRISTIGIVTLLLEAERRAWGGVLWASLPAPGEGTLASRLAGVPVRAKTGTLFVTPASALSGYVRSHDGRRVAFSVISRGLDKATAVGIEDAVARILAGADLR
jgi:serine-type D-Ala-D-Ala carboxypeptidase/endopeptidase (penicillin-binding protein 4)